MLDDRQWREHSARDLAAAMIIVHTSYALPRRGIPAAQSFRKWASAALRRRRVSAELSIRLVDEAQGRAINQQYRGKDYATNVLSFAVELPAAVRSDLLGDLVICAPVVAREAREQRKPLREHYAHLTVHGVLHLLGYDHLIDADAEAMEKIERQAIETLGISDPYSVC